MSEVSTPSQPEAEDRLLVENDTRDRLKIGHSTYYGLIQSGALPSVKVGRRRYVRESDLRAFIAGLS